MDFECKEYKAIYTGISNKLTRDIKAYKITVWQEKEFIFVTLEGFLEKYTIHKFLEDWKILY